MHIHLAFVSALAFTFATRCTHTFPPHTHTFRNTQQTHTLPLVLGASALSVCSARAMDPFQPDGCSLSQMDTEQQRPDTQSVFILKQVEAGGSRWKPVKPIYKQVLSFLVKENGPVVVFQNLKKTV